MSLTLLTGRRVLYKSGIVQVTAAPNHNKLFRSAFSRTRHSLLSSPLLPSGGATPSPNQSSVQSSASRTTSSSSTTKTIPKQAYNVSICSIQGAREYMEDEYFVNRPQNTFFGVFDGHGGPSVSRYLRQNLYAHVLHCYLDTKHDGQQTNTSQPITAQDQQQQHEKYARALEQALDKVDKEVCSISHWSYQGSTAVVAWLLHTSAFPNSNEDQSSSHPRQQQCWLVVANIGDSRAVLCRNGTAVPLTKDHKPNRPSERKRIESVGGTVKNCDGVHRVNGILALSRAIGDVSDRPAISAEPDMVSIQVYPYSHVVGADEQTSTVDEFVLLATDGLWEVFTIQSAVKFVRSQLRKRERPSFEDISEILVREALRRGSSDNITVLIVWLRQHQ